MAPPNPTIVPYGTAAIAAAADAIRAGGIVAVPTETVYGLAADATDSTAVARIYAAKGRPSFNPLIVHVLDLADAERIAVVDADARALADAFWPGPLTLVLPLRRDAKISALVTAGLDTIALRVPAGRAMRGLIEASGRPLAAPSANASGGISPTTAAHVAASLGAAVPLVIDDGACDTGLESTIVEGRTILRPGPVTHAALASVLGSANDATGSGRPETATITAPGQLATHYAPRKPLRLEASRANANEWLIGYGAIAGDESLGSDPVAAAANLFAALHRADASDRAAIAVAPIPEDGIGAAIRDRLRRAAHR